MKIPKIVGFLALFSLIFIVGFLFPYTLVLGKAGLENPEVVNTIDFYIKLFYGGALGVFILYLLNYFWRDNNKYGDSIGFFNIGEKPSLNFFKRFTAPQLTILAIIFFSFIFLTAHILDFKGSLTGLKFLPQQFTPLDSLALSTAIIPTAENLLLAFSIGVIILAITFISLKYKLKPSEYNIYVWVGVILISGILGVIWHSTVYSNSDISLIVVFFFWAFMGFLALVTGLWLVPFIVHLLNNFFIDFTRIFTNDTLLFLTISILILGLGTLYYLIYRGRLLGTGRLNLT